MPLSTPPQHAPRFSFRHGAPLAHAATLCGVVLCSACSLFEPARPPAPVPVATPAPVVVPALPPVATPPADLVQPADQVARRLLDYHEQLRRMSPGDLASEVARLGAALSPTDSAAPPDVVLDLSLALAQQHNPGDLARAAGLLEPLTLGPRPDLLPWQTLAQLLAGRIAEQRRLDDLVERQATQLRDTQHTIQQLTEKLEALKAIERSMIKRTGPGTGSEPAAASPGH